MDAPDDAARVRTGEAISAAKAQAKAVSNEITAELCRCFVTPFDREDIHDFASHLYKIPKTIEKVKERILLHKLVNEGGDFSRQVDLILQEAAAMEEMVQALVHRKDPKKILENAAVLQELEQKGDAVRNDLMAGLFSAQRDVRDLILRRDIYDMLEKVVDRFRDVAGVAIQVVLKKG